MLVRVCEEVLCARLAHSPNEREGEMCEMISMQKSFWFFFFWSRERFTAGPRKENGWLVLKTPRTPRKVLLMSNRIPYNV